MSPDDPGSDDEGTGESGKPDELAAWLEEHFPAAATPAVERPRAEPSTPVAPAAPDTPVALAAPAVPAAPADPVWSADPVWPALPNPEAGARSEPPATVTPAGPAPAGPEPAGPTPAAPDPDAPSAIDDLFGESQFREYDELAAKPSEASTVVMPQRSPAWIDPLDEGNVAPQREQPTGVSRTQKLMLWVAGSLVAVLALVALFLVGTRIPDLLGATPVVLPSASPTPTPTEAPIGPVAAGEHHWDELLGGECVDPYTGPWADNFTVVDCSAEHAAQLVARGTFDVGGDALAPYPGIESLHAKINLLCTAPTVIDYAAAGQFSDIQFDASFAAMPQEWSEGQHDYFCFVSRISGGPITGTVAVPPVVPSPSPSPSA